MSHPLHSVRVLLFPAVLLLLVFGGSSQTIGQEQVGAIMGAASSFRPSNPKESMNHPVGPRPGKPTAKSAKPSTEELKRQAVDQAIKEGNTARDANNYELALASYRRVTTELKSENERAYYGLGNLYADFHCNDSAIRNYLKALELNPDYFDGLVGLGYAYAKEEQYEKAAEQFQRVFKKEAGHFEANIGLGIVYAKQGKYEEAIAQINRVMETGSNEDRAKAYFARGNVYFDEERNWKKAGTEYEKAISLKPDFAVAYVKLAFSQLWSSTSKLDFELIRDGDTRETEKLKTAAKRASDKINEAIGLKYTPPGVYADLGLALAYQRSYQEAEKNVKLFLEKINELKNAMPSLASGCTAGFKRIDAGGYVNLGFVSELRGDFEPDKNKQNQLFDEAVRNYQQAIKLKDDYAGGYSALGNIYFKTKKFEDSMKQQKQALLFLSAVSDKSRTHRIIGQAYSSLNRHSDALEHVREAIKLNPNEPGVYESLASVLLGLGDMEGTFEQLKKASDLRKNFDLEAEANPSPYYYLGVTYFVRFVREKKKGDIDEAIRLLKKAVELRPKNATFYHGLGVVYQTNSNADEALANYEKSIQFNPNDTMSYFGMAEIYLGRKNYDAAIERLRRVVDISPANARAYQFMGAMFYRKKNATEATKHELKAIEIDPKHLQSYFDLASIYKDQKEYAEAIKYLKKAVEIAPTDVRPYEELAEVSQAQKDTDEAINHLNTAIGIEPKNARLYRRMGLVYLHRSEADEALKNFNRAIEYDPRNAVNYLYLARVYSELKHDEAAAIKHLLTAIELDPKDPDLYSALAEIHKRRKNYLEAIKLLNTAITNAQSVPWPYKDLAKVYEAQKMNSEAIRYYEEALKRVDASDSATKALYLGRIARLHGRYAEAIEYFRKVSYPDTPGQSHYDIGVVYVVSKNKKAARAEYERLKTLNSSLAEDLLRQINEMK